MKKRKGEKPFPPCPHCGRPLMITQYDNGHGKKRDCCYWCQRPLSNKQ